MIWKEPPKLDKIMAKNWDNIQEKGLDMDKGRGGKLLLCLAKFGKVSSFGSWFGLPLGSLQTFEKYRCLGPPKPIDSASAGKV